VRDVTMGTALHIVVRGYWVLAPTQQANFLA